jgi:hypothetical protein
MVPSRARGLLALAALVTVVALSGRAAALASVGSRLADFTADDPEDRPVTLYSPRGCPTMLFYEDKDELRVQGAQFGLPVDADWAADARGKLGAQPGRSNVLVLDAAGRIVWSSEGKLDAERERALFARIKGAAAACTSTTSRWALGADLGPA